MGYICAMCNKTTPIKYTHIALLVAILLFGCSTSQKLDTRNIFYSKFDIFTLTGVDTLSNSTISERQNLEFVEVAYANKLPSVITYNFSHRQIVLKLEDTIKFQNRNIYVYYTGNLLGGKAGRQREYSFKHIDNGYRLYVDYSDTLLVKSYDNIDLKSGNKYHYMVDVYIKKGNKFNNYSLLQADTNMSILEESLYKYWNEELKKLKPEVISNLILFPPQ